MGLTTAFLAAVGRVSAALRVPPANPETARGWAQIFRPTGSDIPITHDVAFTVATVWACIDVIASALASSDWNLYEGIRGSDRNKRAMPESRTSYILNTRANEEMTAQAAKRAVGIAAVGYGNGYAEIEWDMAGRFAGLWPISPDRVRLLRDRETKRLVYRVTQDQAGGWVDMDPSDIFHVRGAGLTGFLGDDPIGKAIQSIAMAVALERFGSSYFANGTQLGGILSTDKSLRPDQRESLTKSWNDRSTGAGARGKTAVLDGGLKWQQITSDAEKAQLVDARYQQIEEICRWFRVPPHKVAHLLRATNNNIEQQGLEFSRDTLRPWKVEIEQEASYKLLPLRGPAQFIELDLDWAEQGDYKSRAEAYQILRACGAFSVNDVLRKLGENTIGPVGDVRTMNGAAVRLEDVGKNMTPAAAPVPAAPAAQNRTKWVPNHDVAEALTRFVQDA